MINRRQEMDPKPQLTPLDPEAKLEVRLSVLDAAVFAEFTLGHIDVAVQVSGLETTSEPSAVLRVPFDALSLDGIDRGSVKMFRYDARRKSLKPVWNSGINVALGFVWAKLQQSGRYVAVGLPRDRMLQEALRSLAFQRELSDADDRDAVREASLRRLSLFLELEDEVLDELRNAFTKLELDTSPDVPLAELNVGQGGHPLPFSLPGGRSLDEFREHLLRLDPPGGWLPELELFNIPEIAPPGGNAWSLDPSFVNWDPIRELLEELIPHRVFELPPFVFSKDWPMYQHDARHTGVASGYSSITSTTVSQLHQRFKVNLDGPVNTKPSIVNGRAYIGTSRHNAGPGGTLYKINLCNGCIEGRFPTPADPHYYSIHGIGGSPAIYQGKAYFTTVAGKVFCVDTATMTDAAPHAPALWVTDLKNPSAAQKQPVSNPQGDCWSSPLVVNDRVYVGSGEGEVSACWGFIWCLDANTGEVLWLFCTNKAENINAPGSENQPNKIPRSAAVSDPLSAWATAAGFSIMDDPPETGSSPWSSFAYDSITRTVYIGTGNSQYPDTEAPDQWYGSGLVALDADTGAFRGFHTSQPDDSYRTDDDDIDVPGAPTIFTRNGERVVCYGGKNGSFFLLSPNDLSILGGGAEHRQLITRSGGSGHPGNRGNAIPGVATEGAPGENKWGVMATPAIHSGLRKIYVGLGGYSGARGGTTTPFIRALDWNNLNDAWPTATAGGVTRYTLANPPVYQEANEAALSSPAVVNDVVFVSTTDPANYEMSLYALDAATGLCLWAAPKVPNGGWPKYSLGPAISGEYVATGADEALYIYTRTTTAYCLKPVVIDWWQPRFGHWRIPPELLQNLRLDD